MPTILLTDRTLVGLRPAAGQTRTDYFDRTLPGFGVRVGVRRKTFIVLYRRQGDNRFRRQSLGTYPDVTLADARKRARLTMQRIDVGRDPAAEQQTAQERTFGALAELYIERYAMRKKRTWRDDARMIRIELADWHYRQITSIRRSEVRDLLDDIVARGAPTLANRVLALIRKMLNFALDREWVEANVATMMPRPTKETPRTRVLSPAEIQALWAWLDRPAPATITIRGKVVPVDARHWRLSQAVLKLRLLTAQRGAEILAMRRTDLDLEAGWWTIPGEVAKNGLAHRVFLSASVVSLLRTLLDHIDDDCTLVFKGILGPRFRRPVLVGQPLDNFQPKDLRRTAASLMTAGGVPRDTVKRVLNHVERDITAVYDRYSYDPEKRTALTWWANRLEAIITGRVAKVLPFSPLS